MRPVVPLIFRLALSIALFLGSGEGVLRLVYRDAGSTTSRGPGGEPFQYLVSRDGLRGRNDHGPKQPGIPRILVLGDSITSGTGVRNWYDLWPELVTTALARAGTPHEMAVRADSGRDTWEHVDALKNALPAVQPDILMYQWYANDIEWRPRRPDYTRWWQRLSFHKPLQRASYLYYVLDDRLSMWLPPPERSYVDYLLEDFAPGGLDWAEFERYFHELATRAMEAAPRRLLILYPHVPFRGAYPLQSIHDRLHQMAGRHRLAIPFAAWIRAAGTPVPNPDARVGRRVLQVPATVVGKIFETRDYYLRPGTTHLTVTLSIDAGSGADRQIGTMAIEDYATNEHIGLLPIIAKGGVPGWQEVPLQFDSPGEHGRSVRFRLIATGGSAFTLASLDLPVDYGFEVVDLTGALNTLPTHVSIFDAHPNAAAHRVIADKVLEALGAAQPIH